MYRARNLKSRKNCRLLFEGKEGLTFIVFDVETTGTDTNKDYIVELAAIKCKIQNHFPVEIDRLDLYIKPPCPMAQKVVDIHHITNEFLEDKPTENEAFATAHEFFGSNPVIVGHNVDFDIAMMQSMYFRNNMVFSPVVALDTLEMARDCLTRKEIEDYKLETLTCLYGVNFGITFHNALSDVTATLRLLTVFYEEYKNMPPIGPQQRVYVNNISYWKGYNKDQAGIYLETNFGKMHYSTLNKAWFSSVVELDKIDIDHLEKQLLEKLNLPSIKEFGKLTEKKFKDLKQELRANGVYL